MNAANLKTSQSQTLMTKSLINSDDIANFFEVEATVAQQKHDQYMALPIEERIRKRKAIDNVYWDADFVDYSENNVLLRLKAAKNLSDFKEGDSLLLHKVGERYGLECQLYDYDDDDNIIIQAYRPDIDDSWIDIPLVLDKNVVDMRKNVFGKYLAQEECGKAYWKKNIINSGKAPCFNNWEACEADLKETEEWMPKPLTPLQREAVLKCMSTDSHYLIQGPPGTGKSFVLAVIILEELLYFQRTVVVVGPNHQAINNTLKQVLQLIPFYAENIVKVGQAYHARDLYVEHDGEKIGMQHVSPLSVENCNQYSVPLLFGMTPYSLYTSRARGLRFDTLVIDEAGQVTIPLAQMAMRLAHRVILAGDHKQLPPIVAEEIDPKMKESIFQRMLTPDNCTMLDTTFRMCGPICQFVSDIFYDGQLKPFKSAKGTRIRNGGRLYSFANPVVLYQVDDNAKQVSSLETAAIRSIVEQYCCHHSLPPEEIAVLSPFRAQVADIRRMLKKSTLLTREQTEQVVVDTIDKLQGQEREVIIVSMAAGDIDYMNEMSDFLYNSNKLNVAFSRAKYKLIVVGNFESMKSLPESKHPHIHAMLQSTIAERL